MMHTLKKMYRYFLITLEHAIEGSWRNKVTTLSKFVNEEMTFSPCKIQGSSLRDFSFGRYSLSPWVLYACVWLEAWIVKKLLKVPLHVFKSPKFQVERCCVLEATRSTGCIWRNPVLCCSLPRTFGKARSCCVCILPSLRVLFLMF